MIRGNCRIILGVLVGVMNPQGLLGYLRFCKLCKSYSTLLLCLFTSAFSLWWCNARFILNQQTRCPLLMLCLCLLRLVTKYFKIVSGLLEYKWSGYESDLHSNEHYLSSSEKKAWKNLGLYGIWTHDFCDTGAVLVIFLLRDGTLLLLFDMRCLNTFSITFVHNYQSCLLVSHKFTVDVIHFHKNFFSHF